MRDSRREIIGVVGAARQGALNLPASPEIYFSGMQFIIGQQASLVARTTIDPARLVGDVRSAVQSIDPNAPIIRVRTMQDVLVTAMARDRFNTTLMMLFAVLAMLLAAVGLYGVMVYSVAQRAHEIGVRIALGASRGDVLGLVVSHGFVLVASGLGLGVTAAVMTTRLMRTLLFEVSRLIPRICRNRHVADVRCAAGVWIGTEGDVSRSMRCAFASQVGIGATSGHRGLARTMSCAKSPNRPLTAELQHAPFPKLLIEPVAASDLHAAAMNCEFRP